MPFKDEKQKKEYVRKYYQRNKDKIDARKKDWLKDNLEIYKKYKHDYYIKNKDRLEKYKKEYYKKNRENILENKKEYLKTKSTQIHQSRFNASHSFNKKPLYMFQYMKTRVRRNYKNKKVYFTKEEFLKWILVNNDYIRIFNEWEKSNFNRKLCPTVDRIDNNKDYSFDNIQILTHSENCKKGNKVV